MITDSNEKDIGFVITKGHLESSLVYNALGIAENAIEQGKTVGMFLISDGVWLIKKNQRNHVADRFVKLLGNGLQVIASKEHLEAAGIQDDDVMEGVTITKKVYKDLVINVMENWKKVMSI